MYHQTNTAAGEEPGLNGLDWTLQTKLLREATHAELCQFQGCQSGCDCVYLSVCELDFMRGVVLCGVLTARIISQHKSQAF